MKTENWTAFGAMLTQAPVLSVPCTVNDERPRQSDSPVSPRDAVPVGPSPAPSAPLGRQRQISWLTMLARRPPLCGCLLCYQVLMEDTASGVVSASSEDHSRLDCLRLLACELRAFLGRHNISIKQ